MRWIIIGTPVLNFRGEKGGRGDGERRDRIGDRTAEEKRGGERRNRIVIWNCRGKKGTERGRRETDSDRIPELQRKGGREVDGERQNRIEVWNCRGEKERKGDGERRDPIGDGIELLRNTYY
jgi:hypothetical protein